MSIPLPKFWKFSALIALNKLSVPFLFPLLLEERLMPQILWPNGHTCFALLRDTVVTWAPHSKAPLKSCIIGPPSFPGVQPRLPSWGEAVINMAMTQLPCTDGGRGRGRSGSRVGQHDS